MRYSRDLEYGQVARAVHASMCILIWNAHIHLDMESANESITQQDVEWWRTFTRYTKRQLLELSQRISYRRMKHILNRDRERYDNVEDTRDSHRKNCTNKNKCSTLKLCETDAQTVSGSRHSCVDSITKCSSIFFFQFPFFFSLQRSCGKRATAKKYAVVMQFSTARWNLDYLKEKKRKKTSEVNSATRAGFRQKVY